MDNLIFFPIRRNCDNELIAILAHGPGPNNELASLNDVIESNKNITSPELRKQLMKLLISSFQLGLHPVRFDIHHQLRVHRAIPWNYKLSTLLAMDMFGMEHDYYVDPEIFETIDVETLMMFEACPIIYPVRTTHLRRNLDLLIHVSQNTYNLVRKMCKYVTR